MLKVYCFPSKYYSLYIITLVLPFYNFIPETIYMCNCTIISNISAVKRLILGDPRMEGLLSEGELQSSQAADKEDE